MSGSSIVADTSLLINFFNGSALAQNFINDRSIWISGITEIEILSFPGLTNKDKAIISSFISDCLVINLEREIKNITIDIRSKYKIKLPDAIIAATFIWLGFPLFTMDKGFVKIKELTTVVL